MPEAFTQLAYTFHFKINISSFLSSNDDDEDKQLKDEEDDDDISVTNTPVKKPTPASTTLPPDGTRSLSNNAR